MQQSFYSCHIESGCCRKKSPAGRVPLHLLHCNMQWCCMNVLVRHLKLLCSSCFTAWHKTSSHSYELLLSFLAFPAGMPTEKQLMSCHQLGLLEVPAVLCQLISCELMIRSKSHCGVGDHCLHVGLRVLVPPYCRHKLLTSLLGLFSRVTGTTDSTNTSHLKRGPGSCTSANLVLKKGPKKRFLQMVGYLGNLCCCAMTQLLAASLP